MFFKTNKLFSIGTLAKMHGINKKTLMWYDEVGLLKPALVKANGYRYYTCAQSFMLENILMLRELEVSIPKIKEFLQNRTPQGLSKVYALTLSDVDQKIERLNSIKTHLNKELNAIEELLSIDLKAIEVVNIDQEEDMTLLDVDYDATMEDLIEGALKVKTQENIDTLDCQLGAIIAVDSLKNDDFDSYRYVFIGAKPKDSSHVSLHKKKAGRYLRAYHQGSWEKLPDRYREILSYAQEHNIKLAYYSYERGINEDFVDSIDQYITQIDIALEENH